MNNLLNKKNKTKIQRKIPILEVQNCRISQLYAKIKNNYANISIKSKIKTNDCHILKIFEKFYFKVCFIEFEPMVESKY